MSEEIPMREEYESTENEGEATVQSPLCQVCEKPFTRKTRKGVYCSPGCRKKAFHQRRHDFADMIDHIGKEFKTQTQNKDNKNYLHKKIDELIVKWKKEFRALADEANGEGHNRSPRYD
jgi:hypothetical protein